ncbi:(2Fe-2S)-binding protein [Marispirochaeta sp.]|jgi:aerobic carbon-monoxide dehydrogenase small subunit|uniref:(2Fe-2S)-binding protein n=1 Tax=Marispirochaeta sp. TaxID=2038653 RepID=UPI0029C8CCB8|nr:(2Fe-2S)-binding protein [Marispirochaeta sp.]
MTIEFFLNGMPVLVKSEPAARLLDVLRDNLALTGTKEGCGEGECGACSVFMNGKLVNSCLVPMGQVEGSRIDTIDGVRESDAGKVLSEAFAESHAVQCGFCTPGMLLASLTLLKTNPDPGEEEIRNALSGNICRCTGYDMIIDGVLLAAQRGKEQGVEW